MIIVVANIHSTVTYYNYCNKMGKQFSKLIYIEILGGFHNL